MVFAIFLIVMAFLFFSFCIGEAQVFSKAYKEKDYDKIKLEMFCIFVVILILIVMSYN